MKTIYLVLTFCTGILIGQMFNHSPEPKPQPDYATIIITAKKQIAKIDSTRKDQEIFFKRHYQFLMGQLAVANRKINDGENQLTSERTKLKSTQIELDRIKLDTTDSLIVDSLNHQISQVQVATDSLVAGLQNKINLDEGIIALRDSQLVASSENCASLKSIILEQNVREQQLNQDLISLQKQQKRSRIKNRFIAGGLLFISGITSSLLIRSGH